MFTHAEMAISCASVEPEENNPFLRIFQALTTMATFRTPSQSLILMILIPGEPFTSLLSPLCATYTQLKDDGKNVYEPSFLNHHHCTDHFCTGLPIISQTLLYHSPTNALSISAPRRAHFFSSVLSMHRGTRLPSTSTTP